MLDFKVNLHIIVLCIYACAQSLLGFMKSPISVLHASHTVEDMRMAINIIFSKMLGFVHMTVERDKLYVIA